MNYSENILTGRFAKMTLEKLFKNREYNNSRGYFLENNKFIAYDNSTFNCWVEEFLKEEHAVCWLERYFEISDNDDFKANRINDEIIFISNNIKLFLNFEKNYLTCSEI